MTNCCHLKQPEFVNFLLLKLALCKDVNIFMFLAQGAHDKWSAEPYVTWSSLSSLVAYPNILKVLSINI